MTLLALIGTLQEVGTPVVVQTPPPITIVQQLPWPQILATILTLGGMFITALFSWLTSRKQTAMAADVAATKDAAAAANVKADTIVANTDGHITALEAQRTELTRLTKALSAESLAPGTDSPIAKAVMESQTMALPTNPMGAIQQQVKRALDPAPRDTANAAQLAAAAQAAQDAAKKQP